MYEFGYSYWIYFLVFIVGKGMVVGGVVFGLGFLCFYGLVFKEILVLDKRAWVCRNIYVLF